jgi:hypothetical protein
VAQVMIAEDAIQKLYKAIETPGVDGPGARVEVDRRRHRGLVMTDREGARAAGSPGTSARGHATP